MSQRMILLVEGNPDDEALTRRALLVAHDGAEALDYLFGPGAHAGRAERAAAPRTLGGVTRSPAAGAQATGAA